MDKRKQYRLTYKSRKAGFIIKTKNKTIYISQDAEYPENKHVGPLITTFGFVIQKEIR